MKNHRHLKNSTLLRFSLFAVLILFCAPLIIAASTTKGAGALLCAGLPLMGALRMEEAKDPGSDKTGLEGGSGEKQMTRAEALAALNDPTLTLGAKIKMCMKILSGEDPQNQLAAAQEKLKTAEATLATRDSELKQARADLETARKQITALETDLSASEEARTAAETKNKELAAKEQSLEQRAEQKKKEKLEGLGFNSTELPPASDKKSAEEAADDVRSKFKAEKDPLKKSQFAKKLRELDAKALAGVN